jgi:hypothetical protein
MDTVIEDLPLRSQVSVYIVMGFKSDPKVFQIHAWILPFLWRSLDVLARESLYSDSHIINLLSL